VGSESVPFSDVVCVLAARLGAFTGPLDPVSEAIVWQLRLPRAILGFVVGGGLAVTGVAMQALVRNPLAEPYILGLSSGAAAGASAFYLGFIPAIVSRTLTMPLAAFAGGLAAITVVYLVARESNRLSVARLLLAGVAVSAFMASVTSFVTFASPEPNRLRAVLFWLMGSLGGAGWPTLILPVAVSVAGAVFFWFLARPMDAMLLGEEPAQALGIPVDVVKRLIIVACALVAGILVSAAGTIGFIGLIVPHVVRSVSGVGHRLNVPLCFLAGGVFLMLADVVARAAIPGQDLPVGIVTALCGVPLFIVLLRRYRYQFG
jgi:iron complex transport system permease protein